MSAGPRPILPCFARSSFPFPSTSGAYHASYRAFQRLQVLPQLSAAFTTSCMFSVIAFLFWVDIDWRSMTSYCLFVGGLLPLPVLASPGAVPKTEPVVLSAVRILKTRMRCRLGSAEWEQIIRSENTWSYWYKNSFGVEGFVTAYTLRKNHSGLVFTSA